MLHGRHTKTHCACTLYAYEQGEQLADDLVHAARECQSDLVGHHWFNVHTGERQPEMAAAAIKAICQDKQKLHRVTLRSLDLQGNSQFTQYDMWPVNEYLAPGRPPGLLVSCLDVTHQRQLELNLEAAKEQLQR